MATEVSCWNPIKMENKETQWNEAYSRFNLMVNYIPECFTRHDLIDLFGPFGEVEKMTFFKNKQTGENSGFGFVKYVRTEDASRCVQSLNGIYVLYKRLKVAFARKPSEHITCTNLFVKKIPLDFTQNELQKIFEKYGTIIACKILTNKQILSGKMVEVSRGCGFVRYSYNHEAAAALKYGPFDISYANKRTVNSQAFDIFKFRSLVLPSPIAPPTNFLYLGNLPEDMTADILHTLLITCGEVTKLNVVMDWDTNKCRGYAFATMKNCCDAINAVEKLNNSIFCGKILQVRFKV